MGFTKIGLLFFSLLAIVLLGCVNEKPNNFIDKPSDDYYDYIASSVTGGYVYITLNICDTVTNRKGILVIENEELFSVLSKEYSTEKEFSDSICNLMTSNKYMFVNSSTYDLLKSNMVVILTSTQLYSS